MDVQHSRSGSLIFFSRSRCVGVAGGGREGGWLCTTARSLLWCNQIISFDVSWIRSVRLEKNLHFSFVFKQIVNFSVVGAVALVFLQNSFYITSKESLWFSPNIVHWLFSNTVYEIKWTIKGSAPPVFNTRSPSPIANLIERNICKYTTQHKESQHSYLCCVKCDTG